MARFPFKPGAGAKAIRNPVYWNRLYLQETQGNGRGSRIGRYSEDAHLTARWLNINTNSALEGNLSIELINLNGQQLLKVDELRSEQRIDISNLPNGIYFARIRSGSAVIHNQRIIISR